jgi:hypothetical protein
MKFQFIDAAKENFPVTRPCQVVEGKGLSKCFCHSKGKLDYHTRSTIAETIQFNPR